MNLGAGGDATPGSDYQAIPATLTIRAGATSATLLVTPLDDTAPEDPEKVTVTVLTGVGYTVGTTTTGTVNLADNDSGTGTSDLIVYSFTGTTNVAVGGTFTVTDSTSVLI